MPTEKRSCRLRPPHRQPQPPQFISAMIAKQTYLSTKTGQREMRVAPQRSGAHRTPLPTLENRRYTPYPSSVPRQQSSQAKTAEQKPANPVSVGPAASGPKSTAQKSIIQESTSEIFKKNFDEDFGTEASRPRGTIHKDTFTLPRSEVSEVQMAPVRDFQDQGSSAQSTILRSSLVQAVPPGSSAAQAALTEGTFIAGAGHLATLSQGSPAEAALARIAMAVVKEARAIQPSVPAVVREAPVREVAIHHGCACPVQVTLTEITLIAGARHLAALSQGTPAEAALAQIMMAITQATLAIPTSVPAVVREAPVQEASVQEAPVQEAPVQEASVQEAPVQEAPVQEAPVEEAPIQEAHVEEAHVEVAPVQVAPVQVAPVQAAPVRPIVLPTGKTLLHILRMLKCLEVDIRMDDDTNPHCNRFVWNHLKNKYQLQAGNHNEPIIPNQHDLRAMMQIISRLQEVPRVNYDDMMATKEMTRRSAHSIVCRITREFFHSRPRRRTQ
ncbi:hypothetical protein GGS24DRAFT_506043 [Hypoxylon argillaceum]|nr:hypothetical protein GGS24DRAFT_506043 [Hypoxylon argillaceum]